jgi:hypothetical protein
MFYTTKASRSICQSHGQRETKDHGALHQSHHRSRYPVYTDEYSMYARLQSWGYGRKSVNHGRGAFARDDNGNGLCEVHVNTMEGFWSLLRSWVVSLNCRAELG